jgi:hypothetical protein
MNMNKSQTQQIRSHLNRGWRLTPLQALEKYGCLRLAARIAELRNEGMKIKTNKVTRNGKTFAQYQTA